MASATPFHCTKNTIFMSDILSKYTTDLVTFTEEIVRGNLFFEVYVGKILLIQQISPFKF